MAVRYSDRPPSGDRGMTIGPGKVAGAGQQMHPGMGPGPASRKKSGMVRDMRPGGPKPDVASSKAPKGMRTYPEGGRPSARRGSR